MALNTLVGLAMLLVANEPDDVAPEQAIELLALALHHPASEYETRGKASRLLDKLASRLPAELAAAAQERGQLKILETVITELEF